MASTSHLLSSYKSTLTTDSCKAHDLEDQQYVLVDKKERVRRQHCTGQRSRIRSESSQMVAVERRRERGPDTKNEFTQVVTDDFQPLLLEGSLKESKDEAVQVGLSARSSTSRESDKATQTVITEQRNMPIAKKEQPTKGLREGQYQESINPTSEKVTIVDTIRDSAKHTRGRIPVKDKEHKKVKARSSSEDCSTGTKGTHQLPSNPKLDEKVFARRTKSVDIIDSSSALHDEQECKVRCRRDHEHQRPWRSHMKRQSKPVTSEKDNADSHKDHKETLEERPRPWRTNMRKAFEKESPAEGKLQKESDELKEGDVRRSEALQKYIKEKRETHKRILEASKRSQQANKADIEQKLRNLEQRRKVALESNRRTQAEKIYGRVSATAYVRKTSAKPNEARTSAKPNEAKTSAKPNEAKTSAKPNEAKTSAKPNEGRTSAKPNEAESKETKTKQKREVPVKQRPYSSGFKGVFFEANHGSRFIAKPNNLETAKCEKVIEEIDGHRKSDDANAQENEALLRTRRDEAANDDTKRDRLASKVTSLLRRNEDDLLAINIWNRKLLSCEERKDAESLAALNVNKDVFSILETQKRLSELFPTTNVEAANEGQYDGKARLYFHGANNASRGESDGEQRGAGSSNVDGVSRGTDKARDVDVSMKLEEGDIEKHISNTIDKKATEKKASVKNITKSKTSPTPEVNKATNVVQSPQVKDSLSPPVKVSNTNRLHKAKALELQFAAELDHLETLQRAESHLSDMDRLNDHHRLTCNNNVEANERSNPRVADVEGPIVLNEDIRLMDVHQRPNQAPLKELREMVEEQSKRIQTLAFKSTQTTSSFRPSKTARTNPKVLDPRLHAMIKSVDEDAQLIQSTIEKSEQTANVVSQTISAAIRSLSTSDGQVLEKHSSDAQIDKESSEATSVLSFSSSSSAIISSISSSSANVTEELSLFSSEDDKDLKLHEIRLVTKAKQRLVMISIERHRLKGKAKEEKSDSKRRTLLHKIDALRDKEKQLTTDLKRKLEEIRLERERRILRSTGNKENRFDAGNEREIKGVSGQHPLGVAKTVSTREYESDVSKRSAFMNESDDSLTVSQCDSEIRLEALASELRTRMKTAARLRRRQVSLDGKEVTWGQEKMLRRQIEQYDRLIAETQNLLKIHEDRKNDPIAMTRPVIVRQETREEDKSWPNVSTRRRLSSDGILDQNTKIRLHRRASVDLSNLNPKHSKLEGNRKDDWDFKDLLVEHSSLRSGEVRESLSQKSKITGSLVKNNTDVHSPNGDNYQKMRTVSSDSGKERLSTNKASLESGEYIKMHRLEEMEEGHFDDLKMRESKTDDEVKEGPLDENENEDELEEQGEKEEWTNNKWYLSDHEDPSTIQTNNDVGEVEEGILDDEVEEGPLDDEEIEEGPLDDEELQQGLLNDEEYEEGALDEEIEEGLLDDEEIETGSITEENAMSGPLNTTEIVASLVDNKDRGNFMGNELNMIGYQKGDDGLICRNANSCNNSASEEKSTIRDEEIEEGYMDSEDSDEVEEGPLNISERQTGVSLQKDDIESGPLGSDDGDEDGKLEEDPLNGIETMTEDNEVCSSFAEQTTGNNDVSIEQTISDHYIEENQLEGKSEFEDYKTPDELEVKDLDSDVKDLDSEVKQIDSEVKDLDSEVKDLDSEVKDLDSDHGRKFYQTELQRPQIEDESTESHELSKVSKEDLSENTLPSPREADPLMKSIESDDDRSHEMPQNISDQGDDYSEDFSATHTTPSKPESSTSSVATLLIESPTTETGLLKPIFNDSKSKDDYVPENSVAIQESKKESSKSTPMPFNALEAAKEWEELKHREMLIEQEMQRIEEETRAFKPPPSYVAPSPTPVPPTLTTTENLDSSKFSSFFLTDFVTTLLTFMQSIESDSKEGRNMLVEHMKEKEPQVSLQWIELLVDLILEVVQELLTKKDVLAQRYATRPEALIASVKDELLSLFGHRVKVAKPRLAIRCPHIPRDRLDDVLVRELHNEEAEWQDFEQDEMNAVNNVIEEVFEVVLKETVMDIKRIVG